MPRQCVVRWSVGHSKCYNCFSFSLILSFWNWKLQCYLTTWSSTKVLGIYIALPGQCYPSIVQPVHRLKLQPHLHLLHRLRRQYSSVHPQAQHWIVPSSTVVHVSQASLLNQKFDKIQKCTFWHTKERSKCTIVGVLHTIPRSALLQLVQKYGLGHDLLGQHSQSQEVWHWWARHWRDYSNLRPYPLPWDNL